VAERTTRELAIDNPCPFNFFFFGAWISPIADTIQRGALPELSILEQFLFFNYSFPNLRNKLIC
jgi:hypothetical protein